MQGERMGFQAEVGRLLDIVAHALYSDKSVFLRELVSNASDACDRLRYLALTEPGLVAGDGEFRIRLVPDQAAGTLTVSDNGIGMTRQELIDNLGTIARSGTAAFLEAASGDQAKDMSLIGQFGVGFYAAFMVADDVRVVSRHASETEAHEWRSDGKGEFTLAPAARAGRGTDVILHLRKDAAEFLEPDRLKRIVVKYSDHIALPILIGEGPKAERVNAASALWMRPKSELTEQQYGEFYRHAAHSFDKPWLTLHFRAEGKIEYTALLFVPTAKPIDLFDPTRSNRLKLYVRRVFITDHCDELLPPWLRFLRGIVDSEDLPLNISREMLQHNPILAKIRQALVKRVLAELQKKSDAEPEAYADFWKQFGAVLKEGLYEQNDLAEPLIALARFRSTASDALVSLADYLGRMRPGQDSIYYITGETLEAASRSPHLEGFKARGLEVLLLVDPIDEFWVPAVGAWKEKPFRSVTQGGLELDKVAKPNGGAAPDGTPPAGIDALVALLRLTLKDAIKDVRLSTRLTDSAVCLVADEGDVDINLARLLKQHQRMDADVKRVLEINAGHPLIGALARRLAGGGGAGERLADAAWLLLDQARILQGETLEDPAGFARRQSAVLEAALGAR